MYILENKDGIIKINKNINLIGRHPNCNIILNVFKYINMSNLKHKIAFKCIKRTCSNSIQF
jgi:hypothetical protein